jgi:hypothetical protein
VLGRKSRSKEATEGRQRSARKPELCKLQSDELDITERILDDVITLYSDSLWQKKSTYNNITGTTGELNVWFPGYYRCDALVG